MVFMHSIKYGVCTYMQSHIWVVTKNQMKMGINRGKYGFSSFSVKMYYLRFLVQNTKPGFRVSTRVPSLV